METESSISAAVLMAHDASSDFVQRSYLTYLVPSKTDLDLDEAFKDLEPGKPVLDSIDQRESLFFGKTSLKLCRGTRLLIPQPQMKLSTYC